MTLSVSAIGENPQVPGITAETFIPDQLIAGNLKLVSEQIQLMSGTLTRGAVLGQQTDDSINVSAGAANVGNGSVGSLVIGAPPIYGAFVLTAKSATDFGVVDPEGNVLPDATVGTTYTEAEIGFKITAGGTVFAAGDTFTLNVIEASGNYILSVKTASDGSQTPKAILATSTDASGTPQTAGAYVLGEFNGNAISFDTSWTLPALRTALRAFGIFIKSSVSAADPS
ncbi:head decoration protein [Trinickia dinghuensis]|uniref:Head decoration protein n=1 Tax=Trinickia dinghuensis TaxID=2291023 RepID=A0A3D8K2X0_9BURK|nr:head decoration protein [Trinickia dinghuensis]RDU99225.1 head decoration protein [Trinickia dinghuensis]